MKKRKWLNKTTVMVGVAVLAGLFAAWAAREYLQDKIRQIEQEAQVKTIQRVVAAYDLPEGTRIEAVHVAVRDVPEPWVVSGSLAPEEFIQIEGQIITTALKVGDPVLWANVAKAKNAPFSAKINPGRRAVTMPVDAINSVSGMLVPGDLIDLYVSFEYRKRQITAPLLQGVLVMATGRQSKSGYAEGLGDSGIDQGYSTVTLDTAPEEAAKLVAARQAGMITALLRNPEDNKATQKAVRGDLASILGIATPPPPVRKKPAVIYGDDALRKLPGLALPPNPETAGKRDERGVFELPVQDDIVSAWINALPDSMQTASGAQADFVVEQ